MQLGHSPIFLRPHGGGMYISDSVWCDCSLGTLEIYQHRCSTHSVDSISCYNTQKYVIVASITSEFGSVSKITKDSSWRANWNYSTGNYLSALRADLAMVHLVWQRAKTVEPYWLYCNAAWKLHLPHRLAINSQWQWPKGCFDIIEH